MTVTINKDFRGLVSGTEYEFKFNNSAIKSVCVVGDNGCGKSSLLNAIVGNYADNSWSIVTDNKRQLKSYITISDHNFEIVFGFDAAMEAGSNLATSYDASAYIDNAGFYADRKSHGEGELIYIDNFFRKIKDKIIPDRTLICLDEFDKGFSLGNQVKAINFIHTLVYKYKCSVLFTTHNPFLMMDEVVVYDFQTRKYILSDEYILEKTKYKISKNGH